MTTLENNNECEKLSDSSVESCCSELEQLGVELESREDSPTVRALAQTSKQEHEVLKIIKQAEALGSNTLDLGNKGLVQLPTEVFSLKGLEYLYLEGNELSYLPEDFFCQLPNLKWLDLRRNYLSRLPTSNIGKHENLRNLLLEGNNLRTLPLELGFVKTLNGLNITSNPLEFPPLEVLEKGTGAILKFLTDMLEVKSAKFMNGDAISLSKDDSSSDDEWDGSLGEIARMRQRARSKQHRSAGSNQEIGQIMLQSAELHRPVSYTEMKQQHNDKLKKVGASGKVDRKKSGSSVMSWKVNPYPEPPEGEYIDKKMMDDRKKAKDREMKERQDTILQRRRDETTLKDWRDETKRLKQKKYFESVQSGTKDFIDPAKTAPYGIDNDAMKVMSNEERIKQDVKAAHEKTRKVLSPRSRQRVEEEKATRIRDLERRIKDHTSNMADRRRRPKGTPQEEMAMAKKELALAEHLQQQLKARRREMEYRFTAFIAAIP